jgi:hypothetical protein
MSKTRKRTELKSMEIKSPSFSFFIIPPGLKKRLLESHLIFSPNTRFSCEIKVDPSQFSMSGD